MRSEQQANAELNARVAELRRAARWALRNQPLNVRVSKRSSYEEQARREARVTAAYAAGTIVLMGLIGLMLAWRG